MTRKRIRRRRPTEAPPTLERLAVALDELAANLDDAELLDRLTRARARLAAFGRPARGPLREIIRICDKVLAMDDAGDWR